MLCKGSLKLIYFILYSLWIKLTLLSGKFMWVLSFHQKNVNPIVIIFNSQLFHTYQILWFGCQNISRVPAGFLHLTFAGYCICEKQGASSIYHGSGELRKEIIMTNYQGAWLHAASRQGGNIRHAGHASHFIVHSSLSILLLASNTVHKNILHPVGSIVCTIRRSITWMSEVY